MTTALILIAIAALFSSLYGAMFALCTVLLNAPGLQRTRSRLALLAGFAAIYGVAGVVPNSVILLALHYLTGAPPAMAACIVLALHLLRSAILAAYNLRHHATLCINSALTTGAFAVGTMLFLSLALPVTGLAIGWRAALVTALACYSIMFSVIIILYRPVAALAPAADASRGVPVDKPYRFAPVLWFGIDSATWDMLDPLIKAGRLPNIAKAVADGYSGSLSSLVPTRSPVIWTSKVTGKSPVKHGVRDFLVFDIKGVGEAFQVLPVDPLLKKLVPLAARAGFLRRRPAGSTDRKSLALWNLVSAAGYSAGVVSWLVTDPAEKIHGFVVPEFFYALEKRQFDFKGSAVHPESLDPECQEIKRTVDAAYRSSTGDSYMRERFGVEGGLAPEDQRKMDILKVFHFHDMLRVDIATHMLSRIKPDLLMIYLHGVDASQHHFWGFRNSTDNQFKDVVARYYEYADSVLGELLSLMPGPKTLVITSDHGHRDITLKERLTDRFLGRPRLTGSHADGPNGVFIAAGHGIRQGRAETTLSLYDLAPTLLPFFGMPPAADMDGRPIRAIYTDDIIVPPAVDSYEGRVTAVSGDSRDLGENPHVLDRLKDLGYI